MSSIGSLSSSTSSSIRGYGGLASGLDRDELIKGMTIGTTTKITKQEQKKQKIEWMQEAVRNISDKMISFHSKYTETLTSSSNMFSPVLWGRNKITTTGTYSNYVSVSGTANGADAITIMGVKQKAENAKWTSSSSVANGNLGAEGNQEIKIKSGNTGDAYDVEKLAGETIKFKYDGKEYSVTLNAIDDQYKKADGTYAEYKYDSAENIAKALNEKILTNYKLDDKTTLADVIKVDGSGDKFTINTIPKDGETAEKVEITGGSEKALTLLGYKEEKVKDADDNETGETKIVGDGTVKTAELIDEVDFAKYVAGKSLTFSYNGTSAIVKIPEESKLTGTNEAKIEAIAKSLQDQLDKAFGKGRVTVDYGEGTDAKGKKLSFKTTIPGGGDDKSSVLTLTDGDMELVGKYKGAFHDAAGNNFLRKGDSTRLDLNAKLSEAGYTDAPTISGTQKFKLNGVEFELKEDDTINSLMARINDKNSGANVTVSYQEGSDKFTFTSTENGKSGTIKFERADDDTTDNALNNLEKIFGIDILKDDGTVNEKSGKDAIVSIKYAGSDDVVDLIRDSNSFTIDGLTLNVKGTFNTDYYVGDKFDNTKEVKPGDAIEIDASVDVDKLMDTIKSFVNEYNAIVDLVNGELTTKHESDYDPLTSDQKSELSESEIEKWEAKAKEGLLYGDSDLRNLSMDLRVVVSGGLLIDFEKVGISLSSSYSDNGKLSIDETKLRAALQTDPESVQKLFTSTEGVDEKGNKTFNGLATNLKNVMDKYVKTIGSMETKGILIRKAGSKSTAMSLTQNAYYDQIKSIDKLLESLKTRLKKEQDRFISQFSTLETLISNMNSQSSYLSSMSGY